MKTRLVLFGLVLPLLLAAQPEKPAVELKPFTDKEGGFSIMLPAEPKKQSLKQKGPDGKEVVNNIFHVDQKTHAYVVAYLKDPKLAKEGKEGVEQALERARKGAEASLKAKLLEEKKVKLDDKHPGLEFQLEVPSVGVYRSRIYVVNDILYQLSVLGPKEVALSKDADQVLNSFKLSEAEKPGS
jgi:hypothetical protein